MIVKPTDGWDRESAPMAATRLGVKTASVLFRKRVLRSLIWAAFWGMAAVSEASRNWDNTRRYWSAGFPGESVLPLLLFVALPAFLSWRCFRKAWHIAKAEPNGVNP